MFRYLKIELLSIVMIIVMLAVSYLVKVKNEKAKESRTNKKIEVFDSVTIEINATSVKSILHSDYAVRESNEVKLTNITYQGNGAKELKSKYGHTVGDKFYLDVNVTLLQDNGYRYKAQHAMYDKAIEFFYITSPYTAYIDKNIINGTDLKYDIINKIVRSKNIDAILYTASDR
ncbi:hypothetical protein MNB_SV-6-244 [hydrothermal vent metagenome]|uniref:Uncharacterized protein n=1 Tax=hydrothermal vent metagenome TaxID=652676 RepID=A0A1W1CDM2_9ZZZZ